MNFASPFSICIAAITVLALFGLPVGYAMIAGSITYLILVGQDLGTVAEQLLNGMYQSWILNRMFGLYNKPAAATASASGGTDAPSPPPTTPLEPMKGVQQKSNGRNGRRSGTPGRIKPRGSGR